jgi:predicted membrane protein
MGYPTDRTSAFNFSPRLVLGIGLVAFGALLMLGRLDIVDTDAVLRLWPLILIAVGLQQFFNPRVGAAGERIFPINGVIWMAIGGILLLNSTGILRANIWDLFWPAILIALGVRLMTRTGPRVRGRMRRRTFTESPGPGSTAGGTIGTAASSASSWQSGPGATAFTDGDSAAESADSGSIFAVLSAVKRVSAAVPFHGMEVTAFLGGAHIDLRRAIVPSGGEAVLDMFIVIGGCELVVPPEWIVSAPVVAVMGGVDDKRIVPAPSVIEDAASRAAAPPRLVIRGFVMMGGITIRS